jgi:hypothetical protein
MDSKMQQIKLQHLSGQKDRPAAICPPVNVTELCVAVLQQGWVPKQVCWWGREGLRSYIALVELHQEVQAGV